MSVPILVTKLYPPPLQAKYVPRSRLIKLMNDGRQSKLILISASAGFGKTTLLSEWLAQCKGPAAWLSLDEEHKDYTRFLTYIVYALQTIDSNIGNGVLAVLQSPVLPPMETILTILINEITRVNNNFTLVLDDYHMVDNLEIDKALTFLLENQPPLMTIVIASREDPNLPLSRFRGRGQLTELRVNELRFTSFETIEFINQLMELNISHKDIEVLENRTEGWIAGLQLAAISLQGQKDTSGFIKSFSGSHHFILDYLIEEVLLHQSENINTFLLSTSILDRFCGSLCDALLPDSSTPGQGILKALQNANLFIIPLDDERKWYRYHHLFGDLLQQRLITSMSTEDHSKLHLRASRWYEANDFYDEAISHAIAADDFYRTADLLELVWPLMNSSFLSAKWLGWIKVLPEQLIRIRPVLCAAFGAALLDTGEFQSVKEHLDDAQKWLSCKNPESDMIVVDKKQFQILGANIARSRAYLAQISGDLDSSIKYAQQVMKLSSENDYQIRAEASALLGAGFWKVGNLNDAYRCLTDGMLGMKKGGNILFSIAIAGFIAEILLERGQLKKAFEIYTKTIQSSSDMEDDKLWITANLYLGLSKLHLERGDLETAEQNLQICKKLNEYAVLGDGPYHYALAQAKIYDSRGDIDSALNELIKAEDLYFINLAPEVYPLTALKLSLWIRQGNLLKARSWIEKQDLSTSDELNYLNTFEHITLARLLMAEYQIGNDESLVPELKEFLQRLHTIAEKNKWNGFLLEILILQAITYKLHNDITPALEVIMHALTLAEPEGYIRIFIDEGPVMEKLLSLVSIEGKIKIYKNKIIRSFGEKSALPANQPLPESLTQRELEVLDLVAQGLSNNEIGERLFLALSTVKGHNRIIYDKLDVQRRTEAVARARELGLI